MSNSLGKCSADLSDAVETADGAECSDELLWCDADVGTDDVGDMFGTYPPPSGVCDDDDEPYPWP